MTRAEDETEDMEQADCADNSPEISEIRAGDGRFVFFKRNTVCASAQYSAMQESNGEVETYGRELFDIISLNK